LHLDEILQEQFLSAFLNPKKNKVDIHQPYSMKKFILF